MNKRLVLSLAMGALVAGAWVAPPAFAALGQGTTAPAFTAQASKDGKASEITLAGALKNGPVVVYFFPSAYTKGCNIEAHLFSEAADTFKAEGASVIGVTAGKTDQLAAFSKDTEHCGGKFPVAADRDLAIAKRYDALLGPMMPVSNRTSYVVAPDGKVLHAYSAMSPDDHVTQTMDAVKAWRAKHPK